MVLSLTFLERLLSSTCSAGSLVFGGVSRHPRLVIVCLRHTFSLVNLAGGG